MVVHRAGDTAQIGLSKPVVKGHLRGPNYIRGVVAGFQNRGVEVPSLDVFLVSTVPLDGGLSSRAARHVKSPQKSPAYLRCATPPPTRDANRDSGMASAGGGVRLLSSSKAHMKEPFGLFKRNGISQRISAHVITNE